jgi:putative ABC transport system ATP-binding protein
VGLGDRLDHQPSQLSGGQQQRVAIARALVGGTPIIMADEPTGNLDSQVTVEIMNLLQSLNRERGLTLILVTHEADVAAYAGRVLRMRDGLILSDTLQEPRRHGLPLAADHAHEEERP